MKFGIVTHGMLTLQTLTSEVNYIPMVKRAAILFDKLIYTTTPYSAISDRFLGWDKIIPRLFDNDEIIDSKKLLDLFIPIQEVVEEYNWFLKETIYDRKNKEISLMEGERGKRLEEFTWDLLKKKKIDDKDSKQYYDNAKRYFAYLANDYRIIGRLSFIQSEISGLFTEIHEEAINFVLGDTKVTEKKIIKNIQELNFFDFGQLTWDEIFVLRESEFAKSFRNKVNELSQTFESSQNLKHDLGEWINDAKFSFIERRKPKPKTAIVNMVLTNMPLPFPVNPYSIYDSTKTVIEERKVKKEFDWLFFIQKAKEYSK